MVIDAGRIKHLGDLMHKSIASNGSAVSSNWRLSADGLTNVVWTPETSGGGVSYGSNSNEVSYANAPGASTLVSRTDHVHRGVTSLAHASNTYTGPVTLETEGGLYIVRSAANTYRLGSTGAGGGGGGGGGAGAGTSFPGSPATNDRFFRTDRGLDYYYDGTRWLTVAEMSLPFTSRTAISNAGLAATQTSLGNAAVATGDIYVTTIQLRTFVNGTSSGSAFWVIEVFKLSTANAATSLGSASTGTTPDATVTWIPHDIAVNAVVVASTHPALRLDATKTSTPGNLVLTWDLRYRLVG